MQFFKLDMKAEAKAGRQSKAIIKCTYIYHVHYSCHTCFYGSRFLKPRGCRSAWAIFAPVPLRLCYLAVALGLAWIARQLRAGPMIAAGPVDLESRCR